MSDETFIFEEHGYLIRCTDAEAAVIRIPEGATRIKWSAFQNFENLEEIHLGADLKELEKEAFQGCEKLKTVYFESVDVQLGEGVFCSASSPLTVYYPGTEEEWERIVAPKIEERNSFYNGGWGGGAPGFYWDDYKVFPLYHKDGEAFVCKVFCLADGKNLTYKGAGEGVLVARHSPYNS